MTATSAERGMALPDGVLAAVLDHAPDGMLLINAKREIVFANRRAEAIYGYPRSELIGKIGTFLTGPRGEAAMSPLRAKLEAKDVLGGKIAVQSWGRRKDGIEFPIEVTLSQIEGQPEPIFVAAVRDVTERRRLESELRASRDLLASAERSAHYGSFEIDVATMATGVSDGFKAAFGLAPDSNKKLEELTAMVIEEDRQAAMDATSKALTTVGSIYFKYRLRRADGEARPFDVSMHTVAGPDGKPARVFGIARDLTEQNKAEKALRESEARFSAIFHNSLIPLLLTRASDGTHLEVNEAYLRLIGWTREKVIGRTSIELGMLRNQAARAKTLKDAEGPQSAAGIEMQIQAHDGRLLDVVVATTRLESNGERCFATALMDITDRKKAEAALAHLAAIVASSNDAIVGEDTEGRIVSWNHGAHVMFGWTAAEVIGKAVDILHPAGVVAEDRSMMERLKRGEQIEHIEAERRHKDGHPVHVSLSLSPVLDHVGKLVGGAKIMRDVTERNKLRIVHEINLELERRVEQRTAELTVANKDLEAFAYSVSHDLRAPLRSLSGFSQILIDDHGRALSPEARHDVDMILDSARDMGLLVDDLLAFSRLGRQPVTVEEVDMERLAREVYAQMKGQAASDLRIRFDGLPPAQADPTLVRQVWANLLNNAVKYSRKKEHPEVTVGWDERARAYFVRDNGVGFDMKYADQLFGVFQRLHRAEDYEGTGVGLAIVQRIITRHHGKVWADAEPDKGATFYFTIPGDAP